ncbi:hypothetical protein GO730_26780 [Spirosoma sp. HMF3257]|uniref:Uncharacterized protein n=1 Tax=Spirosoma telluris TaxID=2183553 RepID=A0A327NSE0_9BACT|nr:hypothetical protein [Spirosoma telluris]RAI76866.1 hypothetical protein HMF3257_26705 [Spirosoma telluris]
MTKQLYLLIIQGLPDLLFPGQFGFAGIATSELNSENDFALMVKSAIEGSTSAYQKINRRKKPLLSLVKASQVDSFWVGRLQHFRQQSGWLSNSYFVLMDLSG